MGQNQLEGGTMGQNQLLGELLEREGGGGGGGWSGKEEEYGSKTKFGGLCICSSLSNC